MKSYQKITLSVLVGILSVISLFTVYQVIKSEKQETIAVESTESNQKKEVEAQQAEEVAAAKRLAQSYAYDEALALIQQNPSPEAKELIGAIQQEQAELVSWSDPAQIPHLFFHSMIVDPNKAFHSNQAEGYKEYMATIPEFNQTVEQLYQRGFVLVSLGKLIDATDRNQLKFQEIRLPKGKRPVILSQDDTSYYEYMEGHGFAKKLLLTKEGKVKNLYTEGGKEEIGDFDMVPLLDTFVEKHPDFSYKGAKGTIALTGYNGVLGYRTSKSEYGDNETTNAEIEEAKKVAEQMKKEGWEFASHTWGHLNMTSTPLATIQKDNEKWQAEVPPVIGATNILIYPFGADISDIKPYEAANQKFTYLKDQGFSIFCNVDASTTSWGQLGNDFYRNARINIDGIRFKAELDGQNDVLKEFMDTPTVIDQKARAIGKE